MYLSITIYNWSWLVLNIYLGQMGDMERMAASFLCDKNDPTILTWREVKTLILQCLLNTVIVIIASLSLWQEWCFQITLAIPLPESLNNLSYRVFYRSKTVGGLAQTSCCPIASSPTIWRTAKRLWKSHAAWRVKTPLIKVNRYIHPKFPFMSQIFDTEASVPDEQSAGGSGSSKNW